MQLKKNAVIAKRKLKVRKRTMDFMNQSGHWIKKKAQRVPSWKIWSNKRVTNGFSWALKFLLLVLITRLGWDIGKRVNDEKYYLNTFSVPRELEEKGITSDLISKVIIWQINHIEYRANLTDEKGDIKRITPQLSLEVRQNDDLEYSGISYNSLVRFFANFIKKRNLIDGEVLMDSSRISMSINIDNIDYIGWSTSSDSLRELDKLHVVACQSADQLAARVNPVHYALYKLNDDDYLSCIEHITQSINYVNTRDVESLYSILGDCYFFLNNMSAALKSYQNCVKHGGKRITTYNQIAYCFTALGNFDSARKYLFNTKGEVRFKNDSTHYYNTVGTFYKKEGNIDSAVQYYREAIRADSFYYYPILNLSDIYAGKNEFDSVNSYLTLYLQKLPRRGLKYRNVNVIYSQVNSYLTEDSLIKAIGPTSYTNKFVAFSIAHCYFERDKFDSVEVYLKRALKIDANFLEPLLLLAELHTVFGNFSQADLYYSDAEKKFGISHAIRLSWAKCLIAQGDFHLAMEKLEPFESEDAISLRGIIYTLQSNYKSARYRFVQAQSINSSNVDHLINYASFSIDREQYDYSIYLSKRVLEIDSFNVKAFILIANCYLKMGRIGEAIDFLFKSLDVKPTSTAFFLLSQIAYKKGDELAAKGNAEKGLRLEPNHISALSFLADYYSRRDQNDQAIKYYRRLENIMAMEAPDFNNYGICLNRERKFDLAIIKFKRAIAMNGNSCSALLNWGNTLLRQHKDPLGDSEFRAALQLSNCDLNYWLDENRLNYRYNPKEN